MTGPAGTSRTIIIGDVHGCLDELRSLLELAAVNAASDRVILVGDLVAKGPDSQGVVQACREGGFSAVLGNHDAKVLSLRSSAGSSPPPSSESSQNHQEVASTLGREDWDYLHALPLWLRVPDHPGMLVVHAGMVPGIELDQQPRGYLLNLRSIASDGEPSKRIDGGVPWASVWRGPEHVVFGHDAVRGLQRYPHATGLDTGCVYGRALTALVLPERRFISVRARRTYAK